MASLSHDFHVNPGDWRQSLRTNQRRTWAVIGVFILIYVALGFLIDLFINAEKYPQAPLGLISEALVTGRLFPIATLITTAVALISLWVTYAFSDKLMLLGTEYHQINAENANNLLEKQLYNTVEEMTIAAGLRYVPKVYIIEADYMNAFASGYSEKSAMVAITRGLLEKLDRAEIQAVMAHELSHIRHMDIKLTLTASVLSNLTLMVIDILFFGVLFGGRRGREREGGNWLVIIIVILRYLLPLITVLLMLFLSRTREYMADAGAVELMRDNEPLGRALLKIQGDYDANKTHYSTAYQRTPHEEVRREAYIFDPTVAGLSPKQASSDFLSSHPNIYKRLAAIGLKIK